MPCRVGMTTDPSERRRHWESRHSTLRNWQIVARNLTYAEALRREESVADTYGCVRAPGGRRVEGRDYVVYRFDY